jgi:hypothetical protein
MVTLDHAVSRSGFGASNMKLILRGEGLTPDLQCAIRRHLEFVFFRYLGWVERLTCNWNTEGNGKGCTPLLYRCVLRLRFRSGEESVVSTGSEDLMEAMRLAADRASRLAARRWSVFQQQTPLNTLPGKQP